MTQRRKVAVAVFGVASLLTLTLLVIAYVAMFSETVWFPHDKYGDRASGFVMLSIFLTAGFWGAGFFLWDE